MWVCVSGSSRWSAHIPQAKVEDEVVGVEQAIGQEGSGSSTQDRQRERERDRSRWINGVDKDKPVSKGDGRAMNKKVRLFGKINLFSIGR